MQYERPEQVAARLLRGAGVAIVAAVDAPEHDDLDLTVHCAGPRGATVIVTNPSPDSHWRGDNTPEHAMLAIDDFAPIPEAKIHLSAVRAIGALHVINDPDLAHRLVQKNAAATEMFNLWDDPVVLVITPVHVRVECPAGTVTLPGTALANVELDPLAMRQVELLEKLADCTVQWDHIVRQEITARPAKKEFLVTDETLIKVFGADSFGLLALVFNPHQARLLRLPFQQQAVTVTEAIAQVKALDSIDLRPTLRPVSDRTSESLLNDHGTQPDIE